MEFKIKQIYSYLVKIYFGEIVYSLNRSGFEMKNIKYQYIIAFCYDYIKFIL